MNCLVILLFFIYHQVNFYFVPILRSMTILLLANWHAKIDKHTFLGWCAFHIWSLVCMLSEVVFVPTFLWFYHDSERELQVFKQGLFLCVLDFLARHWKGKNTSLFSHTLPRFVDFVDYWQFCSLIYCLSQNEDRPMLHFKYLSGHKLASQFMFSKSVS